MKKISLLITWLVMVLICLPGCGSTPHKTKVQDVQIHPKTVHSRPEQSLTTPQSAIKPKTHLADQKKNSGGKDIFIQGSNPRASNPSPAPVIEGPGY